jgi:hypothetical protein
MIGWMDGWMNRMIRFANGMNSFGIGMGSFGTDEKDGMNSFGIGMDDKDGMGG